MQTVVKNSNSEKPKRSKVEPESGNLEVNKLLKRISSPESQRAAASLLQASGEDPAKTFQHEINDSFCQSHAHSDAICRSKF